MDDGGDGVSAVVLFSETFFFVPTHLEDLYETDYLATDYLFSQIKYSDIL